MVKSQNDSFQSQIRELQRQVHVMNLEQMQPTLLLRHSNSSANNNFRYNYRLNHKLPKLNYPLCITLIITYHRLQTLVTEDVYRKTLNQETEADSLHCIIQVEFCSKNICIVLRLPFYLLLLK